MQSNPGVNYLYTNLQYVPKNFQPPHKLLEYLLFINLEPHLYVGQVLVNPYAAGG